jgi:hypothetical protein
MIVASDAILLGLDVGRALPHTRRGVLFVQADVRRLALLPNLPTLVIDTGTSGSLLSAIFSDPARDARRIVVAAEKQSDPLDARRTIADRYHPQYSTTTFLELV